MKRKILVDLDAYFDTRLATLHRLYPDVAREFLNEKYFGRMSDEFHLIDPRVDGGAYQDAYAKRDVETLYFARPTEMAFLLKNYIQELELEHLKDNPEVKGVEVEINIHPYDLSDELRAEFAVMVAARCGLYTKVSTVSVPPSALTFERLKAEGWTNVILYDFNRWFMEVFSQYKDRPTGDPTMIIVAPALVLNLEEAKDTTKRTLPDGRVLDPFDTTTAYFAELANLEFLPASTFSLFMEPQGDTL